MWLTPASRHLPFDVILTSLLIRQIWVSYRRELAGKGTCYTLIKKKKAAISRSQESYLGTGHGGAHTAFCRNYKGQASLGVHLPFCTNQCRRCERGGSFLLLVKSLHTCGDSAGVSITCSPSTAQQRGSTGLFLPFQAAGQMQNTHLFPH